MSALNKIACMQQRRDEAPNIELAKALAGEKFRPKDIPQHAESIFIAVNPENKKEYTDILHERQNI